MVSASSSSDAGEAALVSQKVVAASNTIPIGQTASMNDTSRIATATPHSTIMTPKISTRLCSSSGIASVTGNVTDGCP